MDYDDDDDSLDDEVNDIISQIKNQSKGLTNPEKKYPELTKEGLEEFVIVNAGKVVNNSLEMLDRLKSEVMAGADSKLIESVSELVKATTSAIDSLSKLKIAEDKNKNQKEITQMNIDAKITKDDDGDGVPKLALTRNEVLKLLTTKDQPVIDVPSMDG